MTRLDGIGTCRKIETGVGAPSGKGVFLCILPSVPLIVSPSLGRLTVKR